MPTPTPTLALATCAELPTLDEDDRLIAPALAAIGIAAAPAIWDDPQVDWGAFDAVVIRNTWDYTQRREQWLAWAAGVPRVLNPPQVLEWSTDKRYVADLRAAGLPVVPTAFAGPGEPFPLLEGEVVVKPAVGAGSIGARRFVPDERPAAVRHAAALNAQGQVAIVQPYLREVQDGRGETALIYLGGDFSHAIHKGPLLAGGREPTPEETLFLLEQINPREPTSAELAVGARVHDWLVGRFGVLPYGRIDLLPALGGHVVLEVELAEPSLFLGTSPGAPERFAEAIRAAISAR